MTPSYMPEKLAKLFTKAFLQKYFCKKVFASGDGKSTSTSTNPSTRTSNSKGHIQGMCGDCVVRAEQFFSTLCNQKDKTSEW